MKNKVLGFILILAVIALAVLFGMKYLNNEEVANSNLENDNNVVADNVKQPDPVPETWAGNKRSYAVMIDNVGDARPQSSLNEAEIVYEVTVEGKLTRLLAVYKNIENVEQTIGPVRSARPVFIDYALENDSIFVHYGYSDKAKDEIDNQKIINNINGLVASSDTFWRSKEKKAPHNAITNMKALIAYAEKKGYRTTSDKDSVLNYVVDEVNLETENIANTVNIPYTSTYKLAFKYNEEKKIYERYLNGTVQTDWFTKEKITAKNIIITFANNYTTDEENGYGRQKIENIGTLDGYYITNGKEIKITCTKSSRSGQTVYKDETGKEIEVNDGNTYIQIVPLNTNVTFE